MAAAVPAPTAGLGCRHDIMAGVSVHVPSLTTNDDTAMEMLAVMGGVV